MRSRIAAIRHRFGKPPAHPELALRLPQQQQTAIRGLVAAVKIHCEFLAANGWQVEGKRRIVGHDGCGARLIYDAIRSGHRFACMAISEPKLRKCYEHNTYARFLASSFVRLREPWE